MFDAEPRPRWRVVSGVPESLGEIPWHRPVDGITRFRLLDQALPAGAIAHCAVHVVSEGLAPAPDWRYAEPHAHDFDEVNILVSERGPLRYRYEVDGATVHVESPCTVFLPAGTVHRMEAVGGTGIFICMHLRARSRP